MNTIQYSLFENRMQSILTDIVCIALENRPHLIENQVETSLDNFKLNKQLIVESESKKDTFNRIEFELNLKSFDGSYIAKFEMYFDKNGAYNETSFNLIEPEFIDENLVENLSLEKEKLAKNIFKGKEKSSKFETMKFVNLDNQMQSFFLEILTTAMINRPNLIETEYHKDEFNINQDLIIESEMKFDCHKQPQFHVNLKTKNDKYIVQFELTVIDDFTNSEHGFYLDTEDYIDTNLINILQLHKQEIVKNIFKYPKV